MMLPSLELLSKITHYAQQKGGRNYCLFLLTYHSGLRISEAVSFNLELVQKNNFYLVKSKGKFRSVYVSEQVISELKKQAWEPSKITRFGFYKFLRKVRKELKIGVENGVSAEQIELSPHTLRRCFATYWAESGVPLPVLSKVLGHESVRTTALYWKLRSNSTERSQSEGQGKSEEVSQMVIKGWLEQNQFSEQRNLLIHEEKQVKIIQSLREENEVLVEQKEELVRKVKKLEEQLKNRTDLEVKRVREGEEVERKDPKVKAQIEWKPKKVCV